LKSDWLKKKKENSIHRKERKGRKGKKTKLIRYFERGLYVVQAPRLRGEKNPQPRRLCHTRKSSPPPCGAGASPAGREKTTAEAAVPRNRGAEW
jgi:hypothetical protein